MKIVVATPPGHFSGNRYPCPFPSRWTSLFPNYPIFIFFPYELAYMSSLLKRECPEHEIKMVDGTYLRFTSDDYIKYLEHEKPDMVIFETDTVTYQETLKVAKAIKAKLGTKIIMTGQYSTVFPEKVLEDGNDYACIGEYEEAVLEIIKGNDPKFIEGLHPNRHRKVLNIDSLPDPEDDDIRRIDYSYPGGCRWTLFKTVEVHATRGCPYSCNFCVAGTLYYEKPNWRARSVERVVNEISTLRKKYPEIEGVFFNEETHIVKKSWILELCQAIIESGNNDLHYEAMANHQLLNEEILVALKKAGYYRLRIGIETIDADTGKSIGRKTKPQKLQTILKIAKRLGIEIYGTFIIGASGSSKEGDKATADFGAELLSQGLIASHQASIAVPHPGTPFYNLAKKEGWLKTDSLEKFNGVTGSVLDYPEYSGDEIKKSLEYLGETFMKARPLDTVREVRSVAMGKTVLKEVDRARVKASLLEIEKTFLDCNYNEAISKSDKLLSDFPNLLKPRYIKASSLISIGKRDEGLALYYEVLNIAQDYDDALAYGSGAHFHIAELLIEGEKLDEAMRHIKKCMHLNPLHKKAREFYWKLLAQGVQNVAVSFGNYE